LENMYDIVPGLLLVFLGIQIIVKTVFGIELPFFKLFCGFVLIYIGLKILFN
jgi:small neutral amino acid transporter SnatA (MarC family)